MDSMGNRARRALQGLAFGLVSVLLAACGGGTEQITPFEPTRYIVFGDEQSVLTSDVPLGRKYTVNALDSTGVVGCAINTSSQPSLLWTQILAATYNFVFAECNPAALPVTAFTYAAAGAKVDDFAAQVAKARDDHGPFGCHDMMSVLIGANDVIDLFEKVYLLSPTVETANTLAAELSARGARAGQLVADLTANHGPAFIVSTMPQMNLTPYARLQAAAHPGVNAIGVLDQFSTAFNTALRTTIPNDGTRWGLVELDSLLNAGYTNPGNYGLTNVVDPVCKAATWGTPDCTTNTLVANANTSTWLWASNKWMGWVGHVNLGNFARSRAQGNPFGCG